MLLTSARSSPNKVANSQSGKKGPSAAARRQSLTTSSSSESKSLSGICRNSVVHLGCSGVQFSYVGPTIAGMTPDAGSPGTLVSILGQNLEDSQTSVAVSFGGVDAPAGFWKRSYAA